MSTCFHCKVVVTEPVLGQELPVLHISNREETHCQFILSFFGSNRSLFYFYSYCGFSGVLVFFCLFDDFIDTNWWFGSSTGVSVWFNSVCY